MKRAFIDAPTRVRPVPFEWDPKVRGALAHARGAGSPLPEPTSREWLFPNGLGVRATTNFELLAGGIVGSDVRLFHAFSRKLLTPTELPAWGFDPSEVLSEGLDEDFLGEFLVRARNARAPR